MLCCLNPDCDRPINPDSHAHCQNCGLPLTNLLYNRFKVAEPIGRGGFGKTYLAKDTHKLNDLCVVKQLAYQGEGTRGVQQKVVQLFEQEAQQLQQLGENPQIPTLLAYFEEDSYLYLVQQFIEGNNLLKQLEIQGKYSEEQIHQLLLDLLPILEYVHNQGTIHRDIKPENIMLRRKDNKAVLIDFGVSKLLSQTVVAGVSVGTSLGSHGYSPPEQIKEGKAIYASDLFALGATCFHLMSGIHPFHLWADFGYSWMNDWRKHIPNHISPQLDNVMDKLLQKELQNRYQSAHEVLQDLQLKPSVEPTVTFTPPPISTSQDLFGSAPLTPQSPKEWLVKLALVFGIGTIFVSCVVSSFDKKPTVGSSIPGSSPPSQPQPLVPAPPTNQLTAAELFDRGAEKGRNGDKQGAIADYTKVIELDPKYTLAYYNRGILRSEFNDKKGAIDDYTQAIQINNNWGDREPAYAYYNRGIERSDLGDKKGAIEDYTKAIELKPNYANAYYNRGIDRSNFGDRQGAITDYTKVLELDPKYTLAYYNRGILRADSNDKKGAIEDYTQAIQTNNDWGNRAPANAYYNRGIVRSDLGDKQGAIADYTKAIELKPDYANAYYNRALAHVGLGNKPGAIEDYTKAANLYQKAGQTSNYQESLDRIKKLQ